MMSNPYMMAADIYYRARHGSGKKFEFEHYKDGWTVHTVRQLLNSRGVAIGAIYIPGGTGGTASFRVSKGQAKWAEGILRAANVPLLGPVGSEALAGVPRDVGGRAKSKDPIGALQSGMASGFGMGYNDVSVSAQKRKQRRAERREKLRANRRR